MKPYFLLSLLCLPGGLLGQQRPDHQTLLNNEWKLDIEWSTDKSQYLIGEEIVISVTLTNPTDRQLTIADPFADASRFFEVTIPKVDGSAWKRFPHNMPSEAIREHLPLRTIAPGETFRWSGRTSAFGSDGGPFGIPAVPDYPAKYMMYFHFGGRGDKGKPFRGLTGLLESATRVQYRPVSILPGHPDYWVFSLRRAGVSHLCLTVDPQYGHPELRVGKQLVGPSIQVAPFRRIAESPNPITNISVTPSPDGSASIIFTDSAGNQRRVNIDANRMPLTP